MAFPRRTVIGSLLVGGIIAGVLAMASRKEAPPFESIYIGDARQSAFGLLYIAKANKYFQQERLDVQLRPYITGRDALNAALSGMVDLATVFETPVVLRHLEGARLAVVSTLHEANRNTAMLARRDHGINSLKDLTGKKIAITRGTTGEFFAPALLRSGGVELSQVKLIDTPPEDMGPALEEGRVDAVTIWNPGVYEIRHRFPPSKLMLFHLNFYLEFSVLVGRRERVVERSPAIIKLLQALTKAEQFEREHPAEAIDIIARELSEQPVNNRAIAEEQHRTIKLNNVLQAVFQQVAVWFETHGTPNRASQEIADVFYSVLLERVEPEAVTLAGPLPERYHD